MTDQMPNDQHQPDPNDPFMYDVYISYSDADQGWVHTTLLPRFEAEGVRVCIGERDFRLGVPRIAEQERTVLTSRKTLVILSPGFLASGWAAFDRVLQQTLDAESREYHLIPLFKELYAQISIIHQHVAKGVAQNVEKEQGKKQKKEQASTKST